MPQAKINSMRALARAIGVSLATVSDSLRGNSRVGRDTALRVRKAAEELGYTYNPLAGSVMSGIRRSTVGNYRGTTALVDLEMPANRLRGAAACHKLIRKGAEQAAKRLGYEVDFFNLPELDLSISRLGQILESRGIAAVLFLPMFGKPDILALNWKRLTAVYTDYVIEDPPINRVSPDHFKSMVIALDELRKLGYKRPGLVIQKRQGERQLFRWESAFDVFLAHNSLNGRTRSLIYEELDRDIFLNWFRSEKPDVVMCHRAEVMDWMSEAGCKIPETHGYCCLNITMAEVDAAGLDLLPILVGERGMETLIAQLQRNEMGIPEIPIVSTFEAKWRDGPTLRRQSPIR
jgi:DNA-binding LacI/PurR family transcriptional regulator